MTEFKQIIGRGTRIVQKIDDLMALCEQLKERLNQASDTRCHLAKAITVQALA